MRRRVHAPTCACVCVPAWRGAQRTSGFTRVVEAMRDSGKPGVGHNCMFDVLYVMAAMVEPQLPPTWLGFKVRARARARTRVGGWVRAASSARRVYMPRAVWWGGRAVYAAPSCLLWFCHPQKHH